MRKFMWIFIIDNHQIHCDTLSFPDFQEWTHPHTNKIILDEKWREIISRLTNIEKYDKNIYVFWLTSRGCDGNIREGMGGKWID